MVTPFPSTQYLPFLSYIPYLSSSSSSQSILQAQPQDFRRLAMADPPKDKVAPIAVVGMGCRFPGTATSDASLWEMMKAGESAWSEIPEDRMDITSYYHPDNARQGSVSYHSNCLYICLFNLSNTSHSDSFPWWSFSATECRRL